MWVVALVWLLVLVVVVSNVWMVVVGGVFFTLFLLHQNQ